MAEFHTEKPERKIYPVALIVGIVFAIKGGKVMKLTVKNIARVLAKEESECPFCGDNTEICAFHNKEGLQVKMFCDCCGAKKDFVEFLVELEKRSEPIPRWKFWGKKCGKKRGGCDA